MKYYVYILIDSRNDNIIYVGKGTLNEKKLARRMYTHEWKIENNKHENVLLSNVVKKIWSEGLELGKEIIRYFDNEQDAFDLEINLINEIGRRNLGQGTLCNMTDGGDGQSGRIMPENEKKRRSEFHINRLKDPKERKKCSLPGELNPMFGLKGKKNPNYGRKHTDKTKLSQSQSRLIFFENNPEHKNLLSNLKKEFYEFNPDKKLIGKNNPMYGVKHSEETKKKMKLVKKYRKECKELLCIVFYILYGVEINPKNIKSKDIEWR